MIDLRLSVIHGRPSVNNCFKEHLLLNYWLDLTKLGRYDPYMALFNNCSDGSGQLHISLSQRLKIDFIR